MATTPLELVTVVRAATTFDALKAEIGYRENNLNYGDNDSFHYPGYKNDVIKFNSNLDKLKYILTPFGNAMAMALSAKSFSDLWATMMKSELVGLIKQYNDYGAFKQELEHKRSDLSAGDNDSFHYPGYAFDVNRLSAQIQTITQKINPYSQLKTMAYNARDFSDLWNHIEVQLNTPTVPDAAKGNNPYSTTGPTPIIYRAPTVQKRVTDGITSYSGADMVVDLVFPGSIPIRMGTLTTISYSTYREKKQVRALGRISPKGFTKGGRTIAGSMIFTVIQEHFVNELIERVAILQSYAKIKPDELPPFDLVITAGSEYGESARMVIYGVTFMEDSMTLSIEDLFTENTLTYYARDLDPLNKYSPDMRMYTQDGTVLRNFSSPVAKFSIDNIISQTALTNYQEILKRFGIQT